MKRHVLHGQSIRHRGHAIARADYERRPVGDRRTRDGGPRQNRELSAVARSKPVRQVLDRVWPKVSPEQVLFRLLTDPTYLSTVADGCLDPAEQARLGWSKPPRSPRSRSP